MLKVDPLYIKHSTSYIQNFNSETFVLYFLGQPFTSGSVDFSWFWCSVFVTFTGKSTSEQNAEKSRTAHWCHMMWNTRMLVNSPNVLLLWTSAESITIVLESLVKLCSCMLFLTRKIGTALKLRPYGAIDSRLLLLLLMIIIIITLRAKLRSSVL